MSIRAPSLRVAQAGYERVEQRVMLGVIDRRRGRGGQRRGFYRLETGPGLLINPGACGGSVRGPAGWSGQVRSGQGPSCGGGVQAELGGSAEVGRGRCVVSRNRSGQRWVESHSCSGAELRRRPARCTHQGSKPTPPIYRLTSGEERPFTQSTSGWAIVSSQCALSAVLVALECWCTRRPR